MENKQETWEQVRKYYKEKFGIEPELVDIMADYDIIKLCASGASNKNIAETLNLPGETTVSSTIDGRIGFIGFSADLLFSPLGLYKSLSEKTFDKFRDKLIMEFGFVDNDGIQRLYDLVTYVENMERVLDEKWI